ncbi:calcium-independent phospholipase A2-gamma [Trichonephila inaurata madagascariensis]|uniref:Calcium-independent phospholipase A2-gamma n=1 Tax=Trichonephila inaurata madagascariensis TaxID=2747483 RepID=A0A8X6IMI2_9ARAC|nr:calcium-independent phospholipase A2-gamma [Trichonephila inaurata madagascariensis]
MKARAIVPKTLASHPMFRTVISQRRKRKLMLLYHYGTSSKPATNNLPSKLSIFNWRSATSNVLPAIWKSVAVASSILNNITSQFNHIKTENLSKNRKDKETVKADSNDNVKSTSAIVNSEKFISGDSSGSEIELSREVKQRSSIKKEEIEDVEQSFFEWLSGTDLRTKRKEFLDKDEKKIEKSRKPFISKSSLHQRSRFLVSSLADASSSGSQLLRLEEVCKHLLLYPNRKQLCVRLD